jgi:hypothetical protein
VRSDCPLSAKSGQTKKSDSHYVDPDAYLAEAPHKDGSWWPEWFGWLERHSGAASTSPQMGAAAAGYAPLCDAPGTYVLQQWLQTVDDLREQLHWRNLLFRHGLSAVYS